MKLSQYARQQGISYRTALRWWRAGQLGVREAWRVIRRRVNDEIACRYPEYAEEWQWQMRAHHGEVS